MTRIDKNNIKRIYNHSLRSIERKILHKRTKKIVFIVGVFDGNVTRLKMNTFCLKIMQMSPKVALPSKIIPDVSHRKCCAYHLFA